MYRLTAILVGCTEELAPVLRAELGRQHIQLEREFPDANAALAHWGEAFEWAGDSLPTSQKHLVFLHLKSPRDFQDLKNLSGRLAGQPIVALLAEGADPVAVVHAIRQGAMQVILLPLKAEDLQAALERLSEQFAKSSAAPKLVSVAGVTGGCGATTVALNLAYELASQHRARCILMELSLQMGMLATYVNVQPELTMRDLLKDYQQLHRYHVQQALISITDELAVLVGPHQGIHPLAVPPAAVFRVVDYARQLAAVVILDVPCNYDDLYFEALARADEVVLVAEQRVPSIRALDLVRDTLSRHLSARTEHLVINRYDPRVQGFSAEDLAKLLQVPALLTIRNDSPAVTAAVNHGRPLRQEAAGSVALADIDVLAGLLAPQRDRPPTQLRAPTVFGRLIRKFGLA